MLYANLSLHGSISNFQVTFEWHVCGLERRFVSSLATDHILMQPQLGVALKCDQLPVCPTNKSLVLSP